MLHGHPAGAVLTCAAPLNDAVAFRQALEQKWNDGWQVLSRHVICRNPTPRMILTDDAPPTRCLCLCLCLCLSAPLLLPLPLCLSFLSSLASPVKYSAALPFFVICCAYATDDWVILACLPVMLKPTNHRQVPSTQRRLRPRSSQPPTFTDSPRLMHGSSP